MANVLVVFYSRTGNTQLLAHQVAEAGGWECEPIVDHERRRGIVGYLRCAYEARVGRLVELDPLEHRLGDYEIVVVATPTWYQSVSSPVRSFLLRHRQELRRVAFLVTCGGSGAERVLAQMATLAGQPPVASLIVEQRELRARPLASVDQLVGALEHVLVGVEERAATPPAEPGPPYPPQPHG